ncbi:MAG TPA: nucleoside hydrolase [Clostridia bacterium]|nr:nucleoside hydrolase [Clostridia bacterium]
MRKLIIDTDTGSDDAVALIMALKSGEVKVEAVTMVCGNVPLQYATKNALMTIEVTNAEQPPVFAGAAKPLFRELVTQLMSMEMTGWETAG